MSLLRLIVDIIIFLLKFQRLPLDIELLAPENLLVLGVRHLLIEEIPDLHFPLPSLKLCRLCLLDLGLALPFLLLGLSSLIDALEDFDDQFVEFLRWGAIDVRGHVLNELLRRHHRVIREIFFEVLRHSGLAGPSLLLCAYLVHKLSIRELAVGGGRLLGIVFGLPGLRSLRNLLLVLVLHAHGPDNPHVLVRGRHQDGFFGQNAHSLI